LINHSLEEVFERQKNELLKYKNTSVKFRLELLKKLKNTILHSQDEILGALKSDFNKPKMEAQLTEIMPVISEINLVIRDLSKWMKHQKVKTPFLYFGTSSHIRYEAKGVCLILGPWNYPFNLVLYPLISAVAAGNTVIIKPSEFTPHVNKIIKKIIEATFETTHVSFIEGDVGVAKELLALPFDHIFFTGSTTVGKLVMKAASEHLSSVTLELGGKSPLIVDSHIDVKKIIPQILWGKFTNSGQTCIAPDYLVVSHEIKEKFLKELKAHLDYLYVKESDYSFSASIVNDKNKNRLIALKENAIQQGATVFWEGEHRENFLAPTILLNVPLDSLLMKEEIFGPILPIFFWQCKTEISELIAMNPYPLALYIFSEDKDFAEEMLAKSQSGGVCINDVILHYANHKLPFGGIRSSGIGAYHGHFGFLEFSHKRAVLRRKRDFGLRYFYPPYFSRKIKIVDFILKKLNSFL
jgi:aldehyde dehydrogenase (NAD+)